jgi:hypothetical protein
LLLLLLLLLLLVLMMMELTTKKGPPLQQAVPSIREHDMDDTTRVSMHTIMSQLQNICACMWTLRACELVSARTA